jgi:hypothetical protein
MITVFINTRVNESKTQPGRYFNSISGRRLEAANTGTAKKEEGDDVIEEGKKFPTEKYRKNTVVSDVRVHIRENIVGES